MAEKEVKFFDLDEEVGRLNDLEDEVNKTIAILDNVINMFTAKNEIARGSAGKLVLLLEQKISLLTRKESIYKNLADMKKNVFNANAKIQSAEDGNNDFAKILMNYTDAIKKQQKEIADARALADGIIEAAENSDEVTKYFN